jgi:hypothetical protein
VLQEERTPDKTEIAGNDIVVSPEIAKQVGTMFRKSGGEDLRLKSASPIKDVTTVYGENGEPAMYVINYADNGGFVIVGATRNYYPVLAFSDKGSFTTSGDMPLGLTDWIEGNKEAVKHQINEECLDSIAKFREM